MLEPVSELRGHRARGLTRATSWATSTPSAAASRAPRAVGGGEVEIIATVPTSEALRYATDLRSITGGRGRFTMTHSHYDPLPSHLAGKVSGTTA